MGNKGVPAPFLTKTYDLVEDPSTNDVISWGENGTTFVVWKSAEFARDLLPNYFKHNNFSSFVRQLNTYAFRKIVPDKWEFANEFFKRGEKELLCEIHRRKPVHVWTPPGHAAGKSNGGPSSQSNSGDDLRSSSTSSPDTKNQVSDETTVTTITQLTNLSGENEKLRRENQLLISDLARVKKQCEDMGAFFSKCINVAPDQLHRVMMGVTGGPGHDRLVEICSAAHSVGANESDEDDDQSKKEGEEECLKLFGVWMKGKKRGRDERGVELPPMKDMKMIGYDAPWMKISSSQGDNSKVCY